MNWPPVRHAQVAAYVMAWKAGTSCPADPGAVDGDHRSEEPAFGGNGQLYVPIVERGPACFAVWSRDHFGRLSATSAATTQTLSLKEAPNAAVSPRSAAGSIAESTNTIAFADASTDDGRIVTRSWDFGDPESGPANAAADPAVSHTYAAPGIYTVTLTVTDDDGLTATSYADVTIE